MIISQILENRVSTFFIPHHLAAYNAQTAALSYGEITYVDSGEGEVILYCSAMPPVEKPEKYTEYAGPPPFLCNDYVMFLLSPMFEPIMGMEQSTIYSMLPINDRKVGVILDASVTNPDMARNFGEYPIEDLQVPTLIFHAKDDKLASYIETERAVARFPNCTFISFESGGHLLTGHAEEIKEAVSDFVEDRSH